MQPRARRTRRCVGALAGLAALAVVVVVGLGPALAAAAAGSGAAHSAPPAQGSSPGELSVMIMDGAYQPATLTVDVGDAVTWTNHDQAPHAVAGAMGSEPLQAPVLERGQAWRHTFGTAGTFSYHCSVHPEMTGSLVVEAASSRADAAASADLGEATTHLPPHLVAVVALAVALATTLALLGPGPTATPAESTTGAEEADA